MTANTPKTANCVHLTRRAPVPRQPTIAGCPVGGRAGGATGGHGGGDGGGRGGGTDEAKDGDRDCGDEDGEDGDEDGDSLRRRTVASSSVVPGVPGVPATSCVWSSCCSLTARTSLASMHGRASPAAAGTSPTALRHLRHSQTDTINELRALSDRDVQLCCNRNIPLDITARTHRCSITSLARARDLRYPRRIGRRRIRRAVGATRPPHALTCLDVDVQENARWVIRTFVLRACADDVRALR